MEVVFVVECCGWMNGIVDGGGGGGGDCGWVLGRPLFVVANVMCGGCGCGREWPHFEGRASVEVGKKTYSPRCWEAAWKEGKEAKVTLICLLCSPSWCA